MHYHIYRDVNCMLVCISVTRRINDCAFVLYDSWLSFHEWYSHCRLQWNVCIVLRL